MSAVAYQAAARVLYQRLDIVLAPGLVAEVVDAALAAHDTVVTYTEPHLHREMWEDAAFRETIGRRMREQLLASVAERGCVPVTLPTAAYRYFAEPPYGVSALDMRRREVPPELVELGAAWESIAVELSVPVRRVQSQQDAAVGAAGGVEEKASSSLASHGQRGVPSAGAQPW